MDFVYQVCKVTAIILIATIVQILCFGSTIIKNALKNVTVCYSGSSDEDYKM